jgi:hypothetical protein
MHTLPGGLQSVWPKQSSPPTAHATPGPPSHSGHSPAHACVPKLVTTGLIHATAAPAPIRFNILRREIRSELTSSNGGTPFRPVELP